MRGGVVNVHDLTTIDWAKLASEHGINTVGTHTSTAEVAAFIQTEKGERVADSNLCVHSQKALDIITQNAVKYTKECSVTIIKDSRMSLDAADTESDWQRAERFAFTNPWNREVNPQTVLLLLKDSDNLYFFFDVKDDEIVLDAAYSKERDNENEDRVELFFSKDKEMKEYYCLEIDPKGRCLSYRGHYYRDLQFDWEPPNGFSVVGKIVPSGYKVEGAIPLQFISDFVQEDGTLFFGTYRAEFSKSKDGTLVMNWLTWIDPKTKSPDFHVPSSLGKLRISKL
ncbi:hypothetical protein FACS1894170_06730 [Planctomycetales bacterium]|nr:hypothetical protein FACS1894170_06730 [Planctomycetales bacterium]